MQHQPQDQLADITYTKVGGNSVDLGGLPQLKYGHSNERALSFLIEMPVQTEESLYSFMFNFTKTNELDQIVFYYKTKPILSLNKFSKSFRSNNRHQAELSFSDLSFDLQLDNFIHSLNDQHIQTRFKSHIRRVKSFSRSTLVRSQATKKAIESTDNEDSFMNNQIVEDFSRFINQNAVLKIDIKLSVNFSNQSAFSNLLQIVSNESFFRLMYLTKSLKLSILSSDNKDIENHKFNNKDMISIKHISDEDMSVDELVNALWTYFCENFRRITEVLNASLYLGPVRTIPTRNFDTLDSIARDPSTGSVAWDVLTNNTTARDQVNNWLEKFGTNKQLTTEQLMDTAQLRRLLSEYTERTQLESAINKLTTRNMLRFYDPQKEIYLSHRDLGVGISQVLPVIVNCVANNNTTVLIEQPELHLHPRLQGDLADLFIETAITGKQKNTYLLETHSEALILRLLRRVREGVIKPDDIAILYVSPSDKGSMVKHIRIDEDGDFMDRWPNGFFEETYRDRMGF
jgi:predicted ATPase